ncbi:phage tail family protein [Niallia circulans]|uniref:distal tail protein Dit n=1 Tax=Niallia circulans TaxID=1397 RepID=UPI00149044BE|nr:distal tail protein Dit [Niallia circulans]QJX62976.1 phage tail family protein [Niallia circulans]
MPTKLDNYTFEDFGHIEEFGHVHPSTPEFEDKTISIPGRPGLLSFGTQIGAKQFTFPLKVFVRDRYERQRRKNNFVAFLFDAYRQPKTFKLTFDYEPDKYYWVKVGGQITPEMLMVMDQFELTLVANDPTKYFLIDADEITMGSHIPILSHVRPTRHFFSVADNQTIKLINDGTLAIRPRISISGTATNLTVKNNRTGQSFNMSNIVSSKPVVVEGETYLVTEGGVDTFSKLNGKFLDLLPGENNLAISGSDMNLTLSIKYKNQYM